MLLAHQLRRPHHVSGEQRPGGSSPEETATLCYSIVLPAGEVSHRGKFSPVVRSHGRVHGKVSPLSRCSVREAY